MLHIKPIHLRSDEFNKYIDECKEKYFATEGEITAEELHIIKRCETDYGLTITAAPEAQAEEKSEQDYNLILRIKGSFTLPSSFNLNLERGTVNIRPYIIHESGAATRLKALAQQLIAKHAVESVVPIESEYLYEALRESAFNRAMEKVVALGTGFQIIQVEFDENGHFKAEELDETH